MKSTERFKRTIKTYLDSRAAKDSLFAKTYAKPKKNLDDCINYIFSTVQDSGKNGFAPEEIFGMAVHYYDEDDLKVNDKVKIQNVVVNHKVVLTEEEKEEARKQAMKRLEDEHYAKMKKKPTKTKAAPQTKDLFEQ